MINNYFSVVIPTYNQSHLLSKSINSVISQTYKNFEIIVIDNYSTDNTEAIVNGFKNINIKYFKYKNNGHISKSRNFGILKSVGSWISFLDSDDYWVNNKLEHINSLINIYYQDGFNVFCHNEYKVNINNKIIKKLRYGPFFKDFYHVMLKYGNKLSTSSTTINKSFLLKNKLLFSNNIDFITSEDYDLWLRIANNGSKFYFSKKFLGYYLVHNNSNSFTNINHTNNVKSVLDHHIKLLTANNQKLFYDIINTRNVLSSIKNNLSINTLRSINRIHVNSVIKIIAHKFISLIKNT